MKPVNELASKNNVLLSYMYNNQKLLFVLQAENFQNTLDIHLDEKNDQNEINLLELIYPDDLDLFSISDPYDQKYKSFAFHFRMYNKNKQITIVEGTFNRLENNDSQNNVSFSLKLINAKSFSKKSDQASFAQMNFKAMLENTDDFIFFKDAHHILTASSDALAGITGHKKGEEIVGKTDYELFPQEHADAYYKLEKEFFTGNINSIEEVQPISDENNELGWVDNRKYPIKNANGDIVGLFGIARNITELKNAEIEIKEINEELINSRDMLYKLTQNVPGLIFQFKISPDGHMSFPFVSEGMTELFEVPTEGLDIDAQPAIDIVHPDDLQMYMDSIEKSVKNMSVWNLEYRVLLPKKGLRWVQGFGRPEKLQDGTILAHCYVHDITEAKNQFQLYKDKSTEHIALLETTSDGYWAVNEQGCIIDVNESYCKMSGYSKDELLKMRISDIELIESPQETAAHIKKIMEKGSDSFDTVHRKKNGDQLNVNITVTYLNSNGIKFITSIRDVSERKKHEEHVQHLAYFDQLTNLPNRALLSDRIEHAINHSNRSNRDVAICMVDLDGFKKANDLFGHDAGDMILVEAAKRMKNEVREDDTVARLGGDEFVLILTDILNNDACALILQRVLDSISKPYLYKDKKIDLITASIGVSIYPHDKAHSDGLLRHADIAMYKSKNTGKNKYTFFDIISEHKIQETTKMLNRMKNAINSGQFCLYYQPKYETATDIIQEVEALVRWNHPTLGVLSPAEFLPLIQDNDELSLLLDQWVVNEASKQLILWNKTKLSLKVCINISPKQFQGDLFKDWMCHLVESKQISKSLLKSVEFEILETSVIDNITKSNEFINRLQQSGASFALDDFGTGYSSLMHLKELKINTIKIDQLFVREMFENTASMTIVKAVIALSKAFNLSVTAEGAETDKHVKQLIKMGCDEIQGYAISRPLPATEIVDFISNFQYEKNT